MTHHASRVGRGEVNKFYKILFTAPPLLYCYSLIHFFLRNNFVLILSTLTQHFFDFNFFFDVLFFRFSFVFLVLEGFLVFFFVYGTRSFIVRGLFPRNSLKLQKNTPSTFVFQSPRDFLVFFFPIAPFV